MFHFCFAHTKLLTKLFMNTTDAPFIGGLLCTLRWIRWTLIR